MRLTQLFEGIDRLGPGELPTLAIEGITADSRRAAPGWLYVAIRGTRQDGHEYLADAAGAGAAALVGERTDPGLGVPYVWVPDSRLAYGLLAAAWHGHPTRQLTLIGITGTDGKTTTAFLLHAILQAAGHPTGLISTVSARIGTEQVDTGLHVTTPDPLDLQAYLRRMVDAGLTHCVLEATSHGLAQHRVAGCDFDVGLITNITHEHLDFHGTFEVYREAKGRLFGGLGRGPRKPSGIEPVAVLNRDDSSYDYLSGITTVRQISYGFAGESLFRATDVALGPPGLAFTAQWDGRGQPIHSGMVGEYNVRNILAAFAAATGGLGVPAEAAAQAIAGFNGVPGRMERVELGQQFTALVDFAHTPNALLEALLATRGLTRGRVIAVFGSAGLRDRAKRRMMAEIAVKLADCTVLTAEDPRTEPLGAILEEMAAGAADRGGAEGVDFWRVPDRGAAIRFALRLAQPGDVVLVCGKGHEQSMCFGEVEHPWDDRVAVRAALAELLGVEGPAMPRLPTSG
jgi:UDP-N-acetylmuramoyl-L-alanyl-D-glutamate--2,6-diaminopimelate ligase